MDQKNIIGTRVVEARRTAKPRITQTDLIARLQLEGMTIEQPALSKIEHGQRPVTDIELVALCKALKVSSAWLLQEDS
jgi:transcriptional regulator with XRE-family HTH domain